MAGKKDKKKIREKAEMVIEAMRDSDIMIVKAPMDAAAFGKDREKSNLFYFSLAHVYISKYQSRHKKLPLVINAPDYISGIKVTVLLHDGFDSSDGLKRAELELYFRPAAPGQQYDLQTIYINQDIDMPYRRSHVLN
jgi:hypothetical protein